MGRDVQYRVCPFPLIRRCDKAKWSQMTGPFTCGHSIRYFQDLGLLAVPLGRHHILGEAALGLNRDYKDLRVGGSISAATCPGIAQFPSNDF